MAVLGTDTFTGADSADLLLHVPDSGGGTWTNATGGGSGSVLNGTGGVYGGDSWYYNNQAPGTADYFVTATVKTPGAANVGGGPIARQSASADTHYHVLFTSAVWVIRKHVATVQTTLGTYSGDDPSTVRVAKLTVQAATQRLEIDGVSRISIADTAVAAAGFGGIYTRGSASNIYIDYWSLNTIDAVPNNWNKVNLKMGIGL